MNSTRTPRPWGLARLLALSLPAFAANGRFCPVRDERRNREIGKIHGHPVRIFPRSARSRSLPWRSSRNRHPGFRRHDHHPGPAQPAVVRRQSRPDRTGLQRRQRLDRRLPPRPRRQPDPGAHRRPAGRPVRQLPTDPDRGDRTHRGAARRRGHHLRPRRHRGAVNVILKKHYTGSGRERPRRRRHAHARRPRDLPVHLCCGCGHGGHERRDLRQLLQEPHHLRLTAAELGQQ